MRSDPPEVLCRTLPYAAGFVIAIALSGSCAPHTRLAPHRTRQDLPHSTLFWDASCVLPFPDLHHVRRSIVPMQHHASHATARRPSEPMGHAVESVACLREYSETSGIARPGSERYLYGRRSCHRCRFLQVPLLGIPCRLLYLPKRQTAALQQRAQRAVHRRVHRDSRLLPLAYYVIAYTRQCLRPQAQCRVHCDPCTLKVIATRVTCICENWERVSMSALRVHTSNLPWTPNNHDFSRPSDGSQTPATRSQLYLCLAAHRIHTGASYHVYLVYFRKL
ncbi:hypothetical protein BC834DRAFT_870566 [Gloeopeniophorella convolvens]|nr:hypothetical protein BC834DRAFT_870566 [Gloeopeniophorella convolvens]